MVRANSRLTPFELKIKEEYQRRGFFVYESIALMGPMKGVPDFWVTEIPIHIKRLGKQRIQVQSIRSKQRLLPNSGFFVECKGEAKRPFFHTTQRHTIKHLLTNDYAVVIRSKKYPDHTHPAFYFSL